METANYIPATVYTEMNDIEENEENSEVEQEETNAISPEENMSDNEASSGSVSV